MSEGEPVPVRWTGRKDQYPQYYCQTAANLGLALAETGDPKALHWLREAYALRQFLSDQGRGLEDLIKKLSGD